MWQLGTPSAVMAVNDEGRDLRALARGASGWVGHGTAVETSPLDDGWAITVTSDADAPHWVGVRWDQPVDDSLVLGDAWERSYGELGWAPVRSDRVLPWYWLAHDLRSGRTYGAGVLTGAAALCSWTVDSRGVTCWLDLRNGGGATRLGGRSVHAATVVSAESGPDRTAFETARTLIGRLTGPSPVDRPGPPAPAVGANNWYYAYGEGFDADAVLRDAETISTLAGDHAVRPYAVIDAGWSPGGIEPGGPWDGGLPGVFDDMPDVASRIRGVGARPGIWFRPLLSRIDVPEARERRRGGWALDPSLPETLDLVQADAARLAGWGFDLIKYDFSTYDALGFSRFGGGFGVELTEPGWSFARRGRTTAEILRDFYMAVRRGAGDAALIGCNTIGHLSAGMVDIHRVGDDTSGRAWERTRRMGINALSFRLPQHGAFFTVDADCVAVTAATPWRQTEELAHLVAASGTALFLSVEPSRLTGPVRSALSRAVRLALDGGESSGVEPLDWLTDSCPTTWRVGDAVRQIDWLGAHGGQPFGIRSYP